LKGLRLGFLGLIHLFLSVSFAADQPAVVLDPGHHTDSVLACGEVPGGFVSVSRDRSIRRWDESGSHSTAVRYRFGASNDGVITAASVSDSVIYAGVINSDPKTTSLIRIVAGQKIFSLEKHISAFEGNFDAIQIDRRSQVIVGASEKHLKVWRTSDLKLLNTWDDSFIVNSILGGESRRQPKTSLLAVDDGHVCHVLRYSEPGQIVRSILTYRALRDGANPTSIKVDGAVKSVCLDRGSICFNMMDQDQSFQCRWDGRSTELSEKRQIKHILTALLPFQSRIFGGSSDGRLIDVSRDEELFVGNGEAPVTSLDPSTSPTVSVFLGRQSGEIVRWTKPTKLLSTRSAQPVRETHFSKDGTMLSVGFDNEKVHTLGFDMTTMSRCGAPEVFGALLEVGGNRVEFLSNSSNADKSRGLSLNGLPYNFGDTSPGHFGFLPNSNGTRLYVAGHNAAYIYDVSNAQMPRCLVQIRKTDANLFSIGASPDGRWLAIGYADGKIRLYNVETALTSTDSLSTPTPVLTLFISPEEGNPNYVVWNEGNGIYTSSYEADNFVGVVSSESPEKLSIFTPCSKGPKFDQRILLEKYFQEGMATPDPDADLTDLVGHSRNMQLAGIDNANSIDGSDARFETNDPSVTLKISHNSFVEHIHLLEQCHSAKDVNISSGLDSEQVLVNLSPGTNIIKVVGTDKDGHDEPITISIVCKAKRTAPTGRLHVLCVGVKDYPNDHQRVIHGLACPIKDAETIYNLYEKEHRYPSVAGKASLLANKTSKDVCDALRDLASASRDKSMLNDDILIYFSSHGFTRKSDNKFFILTYDTDMSRLDDTAISGDELIKLLKTISCRNILLVADTCLSGSLIDGSTLRSAGCDDAVKKIVKETNISILASSLPFQKSYEGDGLSIFTQCLVEVLKEVGKEDGMFNDFLEAKLVLAMHEHCKTLKKDQFQRPAYYPSGYGVREFPIISTSSSSASGNH
jgi:WD40 repeat protein